MIASRICTRLMMVSIATLVFVSTVLSKPTNETSFNQTYPHNCSAYHGNSTCNCTTSVGYGGKNKSIGFIGQENNLTISYRPSAKKGGKGCSGTVYSNSGSATESLIERTTLIPMSLALVGMFVV
ncbi:hypothetical protein F4677DRAFT_449939 [Hypoxylon crocopeplum]|nr:hypothetical protein F4677DRAFT_449939 [Hypoxylon crocopeplum]